jgi:hypothetical protein
MPYFLFLSVDQDFVPWLRVLIVPKKETLTELNEKGSYLDIGNQLEKNILL